MSLIRAPYRSRDDNATSGSAKLPEKLRLVNRRLTLPQYVGHMNTRNLRMRRAWRLFLQSFRAVPYFHGKERQ